MKIEIRPGLIDRKSAEEAIDQCVGGNFAMLYKAYLNLRPTVDAVQVVRCKDCEWFHLDDGGYCGQGQCCCNENGFCSYGERKKEDGKIY